MYCFDTWHTFCIISHANMGMKVKAEVKTEMTTNANWTPPNHILNTALIDILGRTHPVCRVIMVCLTRNVGCIFTSLTHPSASSSASQLKTCSVHLSLFYSPLPGKQNNNCYYTPCKLVPCKKNQTPQLKGMAYNGSAQLYCRDYHIGLNKLIKLHWNWHLGSEIVSNLAFSMVTTAWESLAVKLSRN